MDASFERLRDGLLGVADLDDVAHAVGVAPFCEHQLLLGGVDEHFEGAECGERGLYGQALALYCGDDGEGLVLELLLDHADQGGGLVLTGMLSAAGVQRPRE